MAADLHQQLEYVRSLHERIRMNYRQLSGGEEAMEEQVNKNKYFLSANITAFTSRPHRLCYLTLNLYFIIYLADVGPVGQFCAPSAGGSRDCQLTAPLNGGFSGCHLQHSFPGTTGCGFPSNLREVPGHVSEFCRDAGGAAGDESTVPLIGWAAIRTDQDQAEFKRSVGPNWSPVFKIGFVTQHSYHTN